jgi:hypothetical protein
MSLPSWEQRVRGRKAPSVTIRRPGPRTVSAADILARRPCGDWPTRIPQLCTQYRRERWSALDVLSIEEVPAQDRLWVVLHPDLLSEAVAIRWLCEIAADALRATQVTDPRSWSGLEARLAYARGEIDAAAWDAAWDAAGAAAAWDAAWGAAWDAARAAARAAAGDAAWAAAWDAAWAAARADQIVTLRTLLVLEADGYDVLRGELGQPITARVA